MGLSENFIDRVEIYVKSGNGGNGIVHFRREKFVPMGGPNGGSGGRGANIIFRVDKGLKTLIDLRYQKIIKGDKGTNGKGSNRNGANAEDVIIKVPAGTTVIDMDTNLVIADLTKDNTSGILNICLNYGSRAEITDMVKNISSKVKDGIINIDDITEELVNENLYQNLPDIDFLIRTSGVQRISNFYVLTHNRL